MKTDKKPELLPKSKSLYEEANGRPFLIKNEGADNPYAAVKPSKENRELHLLEVSSDPEYLKKKFNIELVVTAKSE